MKVKLTNISKKERVSKSTGKPFTSLGIQTEEHKERWLSGFMNSVSKEWKVGDEVEIEVEAKGEYLNFSLPSKEGTNSNINATDLKLTMTLKIIPLLESIEERMRNMETRLQARLDRLDHLLKVEEKDDFQMPNFDQEGIDHDKSPF